MLRRSTAALALILAAASCGGSGSPAPTSPGTPKPSSSGGFLIYTNQSAGFRIGYPPSWQATESVQGTIVLFKSPQQGATDQVRESVGVATEDLPTAFTLDAYTNAALGQVQKAIPAFHLLATESTTLAGHPAHRLIYTGKQDTTTLEWLQAFTVVGSKGYILTFVATPETYSQFEGTAQSIFDTFALI